MKFVNNNGSNNRREIKALMSSSIRWKS